MSTSADYLTGWIAVAVLMAAVVAVVLNLARRRMGQRPAAIWWRAHYWLGTSAVVVGVGHCLSAVRRERLPLGPEIGIWAGALAAAVLVATGLLGADLRSATPEQKPRSLRNHLLGMTAVLILGAAHTVLNGPFSRP